MAARRRCRAPVGPNPGRLSERPVQGAHVRPAVTGSLQAESDPRVGSGREEVSAYVTCCLLDQWSWASGPFTGSRWWVLALHGLWDLVHSAQAGWHFCRNDDRAGWGVRSLQWFLSPKKLVCSVDPASGCTPCSRASSRDARAGSVSAHARVPATAGGCPRARCKRPSALSRGAHVPEDQQVPAVARGPEHEQGPRLLPVLLQLGLPGEARGSARLPSCDHDVHGCAVLAGRPALGHAGLRGGVGVVHGSSLAASVCAWWRSLVTVSSCVSGSRSRAFIGPLPLSSEWKVMGGFQSGPGAACPT